MNYTLPPDEGKKKRTLYWNVCVILGIIAVILYIVDINQEIDERGEYKQTGQVDEYGCREHSSRRKPSEKLRAVKQ